MSMLSVYVKGWHESADAISELVQGLTDEQWATATDLPGWSVQDTLAHLAHLEAVLSGTAQDLPTGSRGTVISDYTEVGVAERRGLPAADVVDEFNEAVALRVQQLAAVDELDPTAVADKTPGDVGWTWDTLLRNRCLDMWCHEQDIRRAIGRPGGMDGTGAQVTTMALSFGMPLVLGKKVKAPAGTVVKWTVTGEVPADLVVRVGDDGRAAPVEDVDRFDVELTMSTETFTILAAGRRSPDQVEVAVTGDTALGRAVLEQMAITP